VYQTKCSLEAVRDAGRISNVFATAAPRQRHYAVLGNYQAAVLSDAIEESEWCIFVVVGVWLEI
jgi:hypothetical protein